MRVWRIIGCGSFNHCKSRTLRLRLCLLLVRVISYPRYLPAAATATVSAPCHGAYTVHCPALRGICCSGLHAASCCLWCCSPSLVADRQLCMHARVTEGRHVVQAHSHERKVAIEKALQEKWRAEHAEFVY